MNSEDSMKDLLIIKATTTEILFALEALELCSSLPVKANCVLYSGISSYSPQVLTLFIEFYYDIL